MPDLVIAGEGRVVAVGRYGLYASMACWVRWVRYDAGRNLSQPRTRPA